jgi:hypothetical protein
LTSRESGSDVPDVPTPFGSAFTAALPIARGLPIAGVPPVAGELLAARGLKSLDVRTKDMFREHTAIGT